MNNNFFSSNNVLLTFAALLCLISFNQCKTYNHNPVPKPDPDDYYYRATSKTDNFLLSFNISYLNQVKKPYNIQR